MKQCIFYINGPSHKVKPHVFQLECSQKVEPRLNEVKREGSDNKYREECFFSREEIRSQVENERSHHAVLT